MSFLQFNLNKMGEYCFCGGFLCKIHYNHYMVGNFTFQSEIKVNLLWKRRKSIKFKILSMFSK